MARKPRASGQSRESMNRIDVEVARRPDICNCRRLCFCCSFDPACRGALQLYGCSFTERPVYRLLGNGVPVVYVIVGKVVVSTLCAMIT